MIVLVCGFALILCSVVALRTRHSEPAFVFSISIRPVRVYFSDVLFLSYVLAFSFYIMLGNPDYVVSQIEESFASGHGMVAGGHNVPDGADDASLVKLANDAMARQDYDRAIALYEDARRTQGANVSLVLTLAQARLLRNNGAVDEAINTLVSEALALAPDNSKAQFLQGYVFSQSGQRDKARATWTKLLQTLPQNSALHDMLEKQIEQLQSNP